MLLSDLSAAAHNVNQQPAEPAALPSDSQQIDAAGWTHSTQVT